MNRTELERLDRIWAPRCVHPSKPTVAEHYAAMLCDLIARAHMDELNTIGQRLVTHCRQAMMTEARVREELLP